MVLAWAHLNREAAANQGGSRRHENEGVNWSFGREALAAFARLFVAFVFHSKVKL
jgi:hypothetical protein